MQKTLPDKEIKALINLIENEEEANASTLKLELSSIVKNNPERIEDFLNKEFAKGYPEFVSDILEEARWESLEKMFMEMGRNSECGLEEGLFLISKFAYPKIMLSDIAAPLDEMSQELKSVVQRAEDTGKLISLLNTALFKIYGFKPCEPNTYNTEHVYFYRLLTKKIGMPITLSCLYILIGRHLNLPIYGVDLPGHFIVKFKTASGEIYIDPYNEGKTLTLKECQSLVMYRGLRWRSSYTDSVDDRYILCRTLGNLIYVYNRLKEERKTSYLKRYLEILQNSRA